MVAAHATVLTDNAMAEQGEVDLALLSPYFAGNPIIGSKVSGGAASVFTDFRIHVDGFSRFLIVSHELRAEQAPPLVAAAV